MAVDNKKIAQEVLEAVGGKDNVTSATHCMTRLRLTLKDLGLPNDEAIKSINGVLGAQKVGGQYQVIIGQNVPKVYNEFCNMTGLAVQEAINENLDGPKEKLTLKKVGGNIMGYLSSCMTPMIPVLMAAGLCRALYAVLGPDLTKILSVDSPLYILLDFMYDACFYYLPILIGFNAAKKLNIPAPLGAYIGCILLAPDFMQMVTDGTEFTILGFKVIMNNYSQTLLPIVVSVAFLALVYKLIAKVIPDALTTIFTPFLTVLLSTPIILLWLAPVGTYLSNMISGALIWISTHTGFFGTAFIGAIWEFLVMTGMHMVVGMPFMMDFFTVGYQSGAIMGANCATWACWGVALGAFFRLRNKQAKSTALGFFVSGAIGGVTEPALYGLCFQYRRCFISLMIGGAVGGAWMGITNVLSYMMATSNFLNVLSFTGGTTANLVNGIIGCLLSLVVTTVATYFIGFTKEDLKA